MARRISGHAAAPGIACGPLAVLAERLRRRERSTSPEGEATALHRALGAACADLRRLQEASGMQAGDILGFQIALLEDPVLAQPAFDAIHGGVSAHDAWAGAMQDEADGYAGADDEYFQARAADILDIRERVLTHLYGGTPDAPIAPGSIVAAQDLAPSRFLAIDWSMGGGVALTGGSATSHVAMLARAAGVPALVGLQAELHELHGEAVLDADGGVLLLDPEPAARRAFELRRAALADVRRADEADVTMAARTRDGAHVRILLNVADPSGLVGVAPEMCDGIGLVRTELLFGGGAGLPDEDTQYVAYRRILDWARGRPVTFRALDAGGDKPIPGFTVAGEANPFLGLRGLRLLLRRPDVFRIQLRALARAAVHGDARIMLPMVTVPDELEQARALLREELAGLASRGVAARPAPLGIMVEVPAAALTAERFDADFYSIGSNDLAQYTAAVARDSAALAELADPVQPAVLVLIRRVVGVGLERGREVSLCGDAGADPAAIPLLLGAGLRSLSMAPRQVARAKATIRTLALASGDGAEHG